MKRPKAEIDLVAVCDTVIFGVIVAALLWRGVPDPNRELVAAAVGFVAGWCGSFRSFRYGSTKGSEVKSQALADQASAIASAAPAAAAAAAGVVGSAGTVRAEGDLTLSPASPSGASPSGASAGSDRAGQSGTDE